VIAAGCTSVGSSSADPVVGSYGDPTKWEVDAVIFTLNGDGTFTWKFPLYTVSGQWEKVDDTTIKLEGKVDSSKGRISVPGTITFNPTEKTLQIGTTTYKKGVIGKKSRAVAFTAQSKGNVSGPHTIVVTFQGGQDVKDMTGYHIGVEGTSGKDITDTTVGLKTEVSDLSAGPHYVVVTVKFNDGTELNAYSNSV
jgi:hypothetical protein